MNEVASAFVLFVCGFSLSAAFNPYPKIESIVRQTRDRTLYKPNYDDPLFLTPFIDNNEIAKGVEKASVPSLEGNLTSYSGYLTVNKQYNSNMFFWFFPAEKSPETAPVILWLQGGPGTSSLFGLFNENGPYYVDKKGDLKIRKYYWSKVLNVLYIDNPVGTGFSFTENYKGFSRSEQDVADNLYSALTQFCKLFPAYQNNSFFAAGESYAGKYVPSIAYAIHTKNPSAPTKINLKGIAIGNGFCDPDTMMLYSNYLYQIGLIDSKTKEMCEDFEKKIISLIKSQKYDQAALVFEVSAKTMFFNATGFEYYFNYLYDKDYNPYGDLAKYLSKDDVRRSIHVGNKAFNSGIEVEKHLVLDIMQSIKPWFTTLVENYRVLMYNGQLDLLVPYPSTVNFLQSVNWSGQVDYKSAVRKQWMVGSQLAGYSKSARGLTEVLVRDAGHLVPMDQPLLALDLITRFTLNESF